MVCGICLSCGYPYLPKKVKEFWEQTRALLKDGTVSPTGSCGIYGDLYWEPDADYDDKDFGAWDSMPVDDPTNRTRDYNHVVFTDFSNDDLEIAYPFHPLCLKMLQTALTSKHSSLTLNDIATFLDMKYKGAYQWKPPIPETVYTFPNEDLPSPWTSSTTFKSWYPDRHLVKNITEQFFALPVKNCWMVARFDSLDTFTDEDGLGTNNVSEDQMTQVIKNVKRERPWISKLRDYSMSGWYDANDPVRDWVAFKLRKGCYNTTEWKAWNVEITVSLDPEQTTETAPDQRVVGLDSLPDLAFDIILELLSPKDLINLTSTSKLWYLSNIWRSRCRLEGFAHDPSKKINEAIAIYDSMNVYWKRVYFCNESNSRRRIDTIIKWFVMEIAMMKGVQKRKVPKMTIDGNGKIWPKTYKSPEDDDTESEASEIDLLDPEEALFMTVQIDDDQGTSDEDENGGEDPVNNDTTEA
ncbi:hypothetical protein HDU76_004942 [Blyttiomyces sp. JEL0837]|nr:hypothetical protein HDU76_004942 [Blyttiomyces sp. JEL0837]